MLGQALNTKQYHRDWSDADKAQWVDDVEVQERLKNTQKHNEHREVSQDRQLNLPAMISIEINAERQKNLLSEAEVVFHVSQSDLKGSAVESKFEEVQQILIEMS
jgi:hypothetical protein